MTKCRISTLFMRHCAFRFLLGGSTVVRHPLARKRNSARFLAVSSACRTAFFLNEHLFLHAETAGFPAVFSLDKLLKPTKNFLECYIIPETVSTKLETEFTAFCMVFFAFLLFEPIVALAPAITDPTAIATPRPFIIFCVFFFIFLSPHKKFCALCAIIVFAKEIFVLF